FVFLLGFRHGVGLGPAILEALVAEPRPVPSASDRAAAAEDWPIKVRRIRKISDPAHAARPGQRGLILIAARRDRLRLSKRFDLRLNANRRQVLLDRLGNTRIRIGVHRIERGREAVLQTSLLHELLRASTSYG